MLKTVSSGVPVCVSFVHLDGIVLSRLASAHTMNYRSVMVFGTPEPIQNPQERKRQLTFFLNRLFPGRWDEVKQPDDAELNAVLMVRMKVDEGSFKMRTGPPGDGRSVFGGESLFEQKCWAGVLPIQTSIVQAEPGPRLKAGLISPNYLETFADRFGFASAGKKANSTEIQVRVASSEPQTPGIRLIRLEPVGPEPMEIPRAGAHLEVQVVSGDGTLDFRNYTIVNWDEGGAWYEIAVLREENGKGGSRYMHETVSSETVLTIRPPANEFPLDELASRSVLIAGGIGITPILPMARRLSQLGKAFEVHYSVRGAGSAVFVGQLREIAGKDFHLHDTSLGSNKRIDLRQVLDSNKNSHIYVCGPESLIQETESISLEIGIHPKQIHRELFKPPAVVITDKPIEIELRKSGTKFVATPGAPLLDQLNAQGIEAPHSCRRGECGVCAIRILGGDPIHRDYFLSPSERQKGDQMCTCVSWANTRLILDL